MAHVHSSVAGIHGPIHISDSKAADWSKALQKEYFRWPRIITRQLYSFLYSILSRFFRCDWIVMLALQPVFKPNHYQLKDGGRT
jgi:hypothetical protein